MKITKITVTSEAVLNYQKSIYSMEVELDEADDIIECTKNAQRIARSAALASVKSMSNEINGTTVNKTIEKPQTGKKEYYYKNNTNLGPAPTEKQKAFLNKYNLEIPKTRKEAGEMIDRIIDNDRESNYEEPDDDWYENL